MAGGFHGWRPILVVVLLWLAWLRPAAAAEGPQVEDVSVRLSIYRGGERLPDGQRVPRSGSRVLGRAVYRLARPARAGETLHLLNFAEAMYAEPIELDEVAISTYLHGPFVPGRLVVEEARGATAIERVGERRDVVLPLQPGTTVVELRYVVYVPRRYWPFGCVRRRCSLSGAIAPLPSAPAVGGRWLPSGGRVPVPVRWELAEVRFGTVPGWVPGTEPTRAQADRIGNEEIVVVQPGPADDPRSAYPSVLWGRKWRRLEQTYRGVTIEVLHAHRRPGDRVPRERKAQLYRDVPGHMAQIAKEQVDLLLLLDQPLPPDARITMIQGPLHSRVAESHPDLVMVSDQALELLPAKRFVKFHEVVIARAVLDTVVRRRYRGLHDPSTGSWLPGMVSFALVQVWGQRREHRDEYARDILRNFTFVPAVDRFLYAGQASFSQAYFRGSEDAMPLRNHPLWFAHELPTGRRLYEKLVDTIGPKRTAEVIEELLTSPDADPVAAAEATYGRELEWFFDQWLGRHPSADYSVSDVQRERDGDGWRYRITVRKEGAQPVIQPVQVLVVEQGGKRHFLIWNGEVAKDNESLATEPLRGTHTWELRTARKVAAIRVDPRDRIVETPQPPRTNVDPLFNNRKPPAPRFLYTGAGLSLAVSEFINARTAAARLNAVSGFVSFEGSLRRDLRRSGHLLVFTNRENVLGAEGGAVFRFGPKVNRRRRRIRVPLFTSVSWLTDGDLGSLDEEGGVRVAQSVALVDDTRRFLWWPERGHALSLSFGARQTLRLDADRGDDRFDLVTGAGWTQLWRLAHDHVIATRLGLGLVIPLAGTEPEFRSLIRAGGIGALPGYTANEIFGLASATAQLEYRHLYVDNLRGNLVHLAWLRSIGGSLFGGTATVSHCDDYGGWFGRESWYGNVGYALTAYLQIFGVTPQLFRVDLAVPLVRRDPVRCLGQELPQYLADVQGIDDPAPLLPPFNVNVTFTQPF